VSHGGGGGGSGGGTGGKKQQQQQADDDEDDKEDEKDDDGPVSDFTYVRRFFKGLLKEWEEVRHGGAVRYAGKECGC
jgi:hypothetical protein